MKKFFTLFAVSMMAFAANAETSVITFTEEASSGTLDGVTLGSGNLTLTVTDTGSKISVDANNVYFGTADTQEKFTMRLKTGGKSSSNNMLTLHVGSAGTLTVYARSASNGATDRNVVLTQNDTELFNRIIQEGDALRDVAIDGGETLSAVYPSHSVAVAAGDVVVTYPAGGINFYCFKLDDSTTAVSEIKTETVKTHKMYRDGQLVLVKEGVVYNILGQALK